MPEFRSIKLSKFSARMVVAPAPKESNSPTIETARQHPVFARPCTIVTAGAPVFSLLPRRAGNSRPRVPRLSSPGIPCPVLMADQPTVKCYPSLEDSNYCSTRRLALYMYFVCASELRQCLTVNYNIHILQAVHVHQGPGKRRRKIRPSERQRMRRSLSLRTRQRSRLDDYSSLKLALRPCKLSAAGCPLVSGIKCWYSPGVLSAGCRSACEASSAWYPVASSRSTPSKDGMMYRSCPRSAACTRLVGVAYMSSPA